MTTTYGIVGCGMMGREHIRNIALMDDAAVGAILEPDPEMAAAALALFAWLLTLHPTAAGRVYAAYGGVYVAMAIIWLWLVDGIRPTHWDLLGAAVAMLGMAIIMFAPRSA